MTKLAIFDVDGTLFDGNLGIEFVKLLVKDGIFSEQIGKGIFSWYEKYNSGQVNKPTAVDEIYKLYAEGLSGKTEKDIAPIAVKAWQNQSNKVYSFAKLLIKSLNKAGFLVLLLSGSPIEMVVQLGAGLEISKENIIAGILETVDGIYTKNAILCLDTAEQKVFEIDKFIKNNNLVIDWTSSLAMGDNERDSGLMKRAGNSFAFEPNDVLKKIALENNWQVVDRNNVLDVISKSYAG